MARIGEISINNTSEIVSCSGSDDSVNTSDREFVTSESYSEEEVLSEKSDMSVPLRFPAAADLSVAAAAATNIVPRKTRRAAQDARARTRAFLAVENASLEKVRHLYDDVFSSDDSVGSGDASGGFDHVDPSQAVNGNGESKRKKILKLRKKRAAAAAAAAAERKTTTADEGASQSFAAFSKNAKITSTPNKRWPRPRFQANAAGLAPSATKAAVKDEEEEMEDTRLLEDGESACEDSPQGHRFGKKKKKVKGKCVCLACLFVCLCVCDRTNTHTHTHTHTHTRIVCFSLRYAFGGPAH
jgi:hypothetical protein